MANSSSENHDQNRRPRFDPAKMRLRATIAVIGMSMAFCLVRFGNSNDLSLISPGEVSQKHSMWNNDCAQCHTAGEGGFSTWVTKALETDHSLADSRKCLECHSDIGHSPLNPHGLASEKLARLTGIAKCKSRSESKSPTQDHASFVSENLEQELLRCSQCHHEHRGSNFQLSAMTDRQCQTCHAQQFASFTHGHPEFGDFPYSNRTNIYFDHATHFQEYFANDEFKRLMPNGKRPDSCNSCHQPDAKNKSMSTLNYNQMCASCHTSGIVDQPYPGIAFLALPQFIANSIGRNSENDLSASLGTWPSHGGDSGIKTMPPYMELLLADDPHYVKAVATLGDSAFSRLDQAAEQTPEAVENYIWAIKRLIYDITRNGESAIRRRLGAELSQTALMTPSIIESVIKIERTCFPNLAAEIQARSNGQPMPVPSSHPPVESERVSAAEYTTGGGWYMRMSDCSVRYRPLEHADRFLQAWLNVGIQTDQTAENSADTKVRARTRMFQILANPSASGTEFTQGPVASGRCMSCHTVTKKLDNKTLAINWNARIPGEHARQLTTFSHGPHLTIQGQDACKNCHQLEPSSPPNVGFYRQEFYDRQESALRWSLQTNPCSGLSSGFAAIDKSTCIKCHTTGLAGQSCLECHNYHSGILHKSNH